jgi:hypothetical protein
VDVVRVLIEHGVEMTQTIFGEIALPMSIRYEKMEIAYIFIKRGANLGANVAVRQSTESSK